MMHVHRLDTVADITMGQAPEGESYNFDGEGLPLIAGAGDFGELHPEPKKFTTAPGKTCQRGDIILGIRATIGDKVLADGAYCLGRGVAGLRVRSGLDAHYLWHWLTHAAPTLAVRAKGATFKQVNREDIGDLRIALPPLPEQRRIAEILDKADALRTKRRAALAQLDALTQSIFLDMFGDPATNPKGWPRLALSKFLEDADVFVDGDWVESKDQDPNGEVRLIQLADIGDGSYLDRSSRFLTKATAIRLRCTPLKVGDVLVARMPDPLGRACIFPGDRQEAVTVVDVCIIRPKNACPDPVWLMCCLNTAGFRGQIAREATGTTRERISRGNLSRLKIIAPPHDQQRAFADRVARLESIRDRMAAGAAECDQLFGSLQHGAFRGDLDGTGQGRLTA